MTMTAGIPRRFLFVMWEGGGNVPPLLEVARRLVSRGHEVRVMSDPCNEPEVRAAGCTLVAYTHAPHRTDKSSDSTLIKDYAVSSPPAAFALLQEQLMFGPAQAFAEDILAELQRRPTDVMAVNDVLFGGMIAAERSGLPWAILMPNCYVGPARGLQVAGLRPLSGPIGALRDSLTARVMHQMFARGTQGLNAARQAVGLTPLAHPFKQMMRANRVLVLTSPAFDFVPRWLPDNVRYVGPQLDDPAWAEPWQSPWSSADDRPLVVVSLSTTFQNQASTLQRVIDALGQLRVRGLVTLGPTLDEQIFRVPGNVVLRRSVPHSQVLGDAAVMVTHAGHGTVVRSLARGVPLLCLPMGRDQADNAVRVQTRGAGISLSCQASSEVLKRALTRLLEQPSYRQCAQAMASVLARDAARSTAADELESLAQSTVASDRARTVVSRA